MLTIRMTTSDCWPPTPFNFFLSPILVGEFKKDFRLEVRVQHLDSTNFGAPEVAALTIPLKPTFDRLLQNGITVNVTYENLDGVRWDLEPAFRGRTLDWSTRSARTHVKKVSKKP